MTFGAGLPSTIEGLAHAFQSGQISSEQITSWCLETIAARNPSLNAFIDVFADAAIQQAGDADREMRAGRCRGLLHGVPIALKDLIDVAGSRTTAASHVRRHHVARTDSTITARLRDAGAVLIGKNNLHEFALGTTNEESAFGPARHPDDSARSPGGSSGGSAAAVAAGMAYGAVGTDTGGSVRIPAAICGLVGLKPAHGEIPLTGVVPLSSTLDHAGPICRSVGDARILFNVLRATGSRLRENRAIQGRRFAVPRDYFDEVVDPGVAAVFRAACHRLESAGAILRSISIGHTAEIDATYLHLVLTEAAAYHAPALDAQPGDYTAKVRLRFEMGRYILGEDYVRALHGRAVMRAEVEAALVGHDALLLPTVAIPAPQLGTETVRIGNREEPIRNVMLRLTRLFNISGHPAITLPCGTTADGWPVGAQFVGATTPELLDLAETVEPYLGPGISR